MAVANLLALIDDISSVLDDVALLTKVATKKTAGVLGDDLALNAQQVTGVRANRELPVVWAVARGSLVNKAILVPAALAISAFVPRAVTPLLMVGGAYLCYEGFEKVVHTVKRHGGKPEAAAQATVAQSTRSAADGSAADDDAATARRDQALAAPNADPIVIEKGKIKGAIRTDFILSAEIITIALGSVAQAPFGTQVMVLVAIGIAMTIGVYGIVAGIVKLDDLGLLLARRRGRIARAAGVAIVRAAPWLMRGLSVAGTVAMFLVGGGIIVHGVTALRERLEALSRATDAIPAIDVLVPSFLNFGVGVAAGAVVFAVVALVRRMRAPQPA
jgi:predicted DNA repair protein MutK